MNNPVLLSTVEQAKKYLAQIPSGFRQRGYHYFQQGRVISIELKSSSEVLARVYGSGREPYEVTLEFDPDSGWTGECSCPVGMDCKHTVAAMKALFARPGTVWSQSMVSMKTQAAGSVSAATSVVSPFEEEVRRALDRPLKPEERAFLKRVQDAYARCLRFSNISRAEFEQMGLRLGGYGWEALRIWPSFPETIQDFWLYVANAAQEHGVAFPPFMEPVTDLTAVRERMRAFRRKEEISRWTRTLGNALEWNPTSTVPADNRYSLRARFTNDGAILEWKRPGKLSFEPMKIAEARQFLQDVNQGLVQLSAQMEWLWKEYAKMLDHYRGLTLRYDDVDSEVLNRFFRTPGFEELLVNPEGNPFERPEQTLRWHLDPAQSENDDYRLRVSLPDGAAMPALICVLEGPPTLFVTHNAVFRGPSTGSKLIAPNRDNVIPAPALESPAGLHLLHSMGVELPPHLRERVRSIALQVTVTCELQDAFPASHEMCIVQVTAGTPEGETTETLGSHGWKRLKQAGKQPAKNEKVITVYDRSALRHGNAILSSMDFRWDPYRERWTTRLTKKFPELFSEWLNSMPPEIKVELKGELASFGSGTIAGRVRLDVTETEIDWFDLQVVVDVGDTTLTPQEIKLLLNARGGYVRLAGKGWRKLQFNLDAEDDEQLARLGLNPRELTGEPQRLHALQLADKAAKKFLPEPQFADIQRRAGEIKARVTPSIPETIQATLRPYQTDGFHFLAYLAENRFGGILADDMGLGKTLQTLTWLAWLRNSSAEKQPSLVVCPKSVMDNWRAETERFLPGVRVKVWGARELDQFLERLNEADLHVLNYSQLRNMGESLAPVKWLAVILDEGQYIKNPNSQTAQVARALNGRHRLVLSGTPIENRLLDLWSLMSFAMPGVLGSRAQFAKLYDAKEDPFARRRLSARVRPFLLRRTKSQVAKDLPDRIEEDLFCEMEGEQRTLYRAELKRAQQMLLKIQTQKQLAKERFHLLTSLLRLRQISCHPRLVKPDSKAVSAKVEALLEQIEPLMEEGHKVLIFSQFVDMLDILRRQLEPFNQPLFYLAGETENRGELVRQFQSTEGAAIFLISLKAGGFGLNLTAASYVVLFDPWWNPAVENQAIDRTHRIGQTRNVIAYRLLIKDSIEEKIRQLQKTKSALAEDVLGEEKFAQNLTLSDLQFLLSDS